MTTLRQQIQAVSYARKNWLPHPRTKKEVVKDFQLRLNDAASTIAAVNLIGEEKIRALPQLLTACKAVCDDIGYDNEIGEILKRLKV